MDDPAVSPPHQQPAPVPPPPPPEPPDPVAPFTVFVTPRATGSTGVPVDGGVGMCTDGVPTFGTLGTLGV